MTQTDNLIIQLSMFITGLRSNKLGLSHLLKASRIRLGYSVATLMLGYSSYYLYDHLFDTSVQVYTHIESAEQHLIDVFKQVYMVCSIIRCPTSQHYTWGIVYYS